jgi:mRNA interferase HigB
MVIITKSTLNKYMYQYPQAAEAITKWYLIVSTMDWANLIELRGTFNSVDYYGNGLYIFDIMGNHYRLIVRIIFKTRSSIYQIFRNSLRI